MTLSEIAALPVQSQFVPSFLESIIDKKVAQIALNCLEELIDAILTWIYCPYHNLYQAKLARVHLFRDTTPLLDSTKQGIAEIEQNGKNDYIKLHNKRVYFTLIPNLERFFSRAAYISYVNVFDDDNRRPGWYKIVEHELSRAGNERPMAKCWMINTNQLHRFEGINEAPFYLAQN